MGYWSIAVCGGEDLEDHPGEHPVGLEKDVGS